MIRKYFNKVLDFAKPIKNKTLNFLGNNFEVSSSKASKITGIILAVVCMAIVVIFNNSFTDVELKSKWILFSLALIFPPFIGLITAFRINIKNIYIKRTLYIVLFALMPIITMTMTECLNNIFVYDMTYLGFLANYIVIILFYFFVFAISHSLRICILSITPVLYALALTHAYIVSFRSTPFIPMDFLSVTTAINVGSTYDYTPSNIVILGTFLFISIMIMGIKLKKPDFNFITKLVSRIITGLVFVIVIFIFYFTSVFAKAGIKPDFWNQSRGYKNYGFVYNFFCNTKYLFMSEPKGYDPGDVKDYVTKKVEETPDTNANSKSPNIICIMNESLSDLSVLGEFQTNEDYMPFMRSLTENTIKGNLYVPVIGAGTSNTEFEFLTGHSTAFLPSGSNSYMLYIKNPLASIVSTLEAQGYSSLAYHPYYASGWNRTNVYKYMGFDSFKSLENLIDISIMDEYVANNSDPDYLQNLISQYYPDRSNMLIRQYISDSYDYQVLIEDYEARDKSKPYFVFNVTMQNHGGYTSTAQNFTPDVYVTSSSKTYTKTNNYLSLVKASDNAFKGLIEYFSNVKEPTIICMFGDHQPSIETNFIAEILGVKDVSDISVEQDQLRHTTQFYIWANYPIESKQIDKLSSNYLSSLLLKTAGVSLTKYNKYLLELSETLPVIDTVGYIDKDNNYYKWSSNSDYTSLLTEYEKIQYNNIFDYENSDTDTFYINGYSAQTIADIIAEIENAQSQEETDND